MTLTVDSAAFSPVVTDLGNGKWRASIGLTLAEGEHVWSVAARDVNGNITEIGPLHLLIDFTPPEISNLSPTNYHGVKSYSSITIQADVYDAGIGLGDTAAEVQSNAKIVLNDIDRVPTVASLGGGRWRLTYNLIPASDGWFKWSVKVLDKSGNLSTSSSYWILIEIIAAFIF